MIWKKYSRYMIALIIIAFFWALSIFSVFYLTKKINLKVNEIQANIIDRENTEKRVQEIPKFEEQNNLIGKQENLVSNLLNQEDAVILIEKIENLADRTGNKIAIGIEENSGKNQPKPAADSASAGSTNKKEDKEKNTIANNLPSKDYLKLKITLNGKYNNLINFVEKLENLEYYSDIISIQIVSDEQKYEEMRRPVAPQAPEAEPKTEPNREMEIISNIEAVYYLEK